MSVSVYVDCQSTGQKVSELVCGQSTQDRYWLPTIRALDLQLLEVALTGGLEITPSYYADLLGEVTTIVERFADLRTADPNIEDAVAHAVRLLETLKRFPPQSGCELYVG